MALDKEYFDSIHIDIVKKKYYNANKVEAVFADIRQQAAALMQENEQLRRELSAQNGYREELGGAVISAQAIYQRLIERANTRAEGILADARRESEEIRRASLTQQDYAAQQVERCLSRVRQLQEEAIEAINALPGAFLKRSAPVLSDRSRTLFLSAAGFFLPACKPAEYNLLLSNFSI